MNDEQVIELAWEEYEKLLHIVAQYKCIDDVCGVYSYKAKGENRKYQYDDIWGIWYDTPEGIKLDKCVVYSRGEDWYELDFSNRSRVCTRCNNEVEVSQVEGYPWYCPHHDEDLYSFETKVLDKEESLW